MVGVRTVLDDATRRLQTSLSLESLDGGEWGTGDALGSALWSDTEQLPYHTVTQLVRMLSMVQR